MQAIYAVVFVFLLCCSVKLHATQSILKIDVDAVTWAMVIGHLYRNDSSAFTASQQNLLGQVRPLVDAKEFAKAQALIEAFTSELPPLLLRLKGQVYLAQDKYELAKRTLLTVYETLPNDIVNLQNLATIYLIQEDYINAQKFIALSISNGANNGQIYGQLGFVNIKTAMPVSAVAAYQNALMFEPNKKQWYRGLLFALINSRANEQALHLIDQLLESSPNDSNLWLQRAQLTLNMELSTEAISSLELAYMLGANSNNVVLQLAMLHAEKGSVERAVALIDSNQKSLFDAQNANTYFSQIYAIGTYLARNKENKALKILSTTLVNKGLNDTNLALTYYLQGQTLLNEQQETKAMGLFDKSLSLDPSNGEVLLILAGLYAGQNNNIKAEMLYGRAQSFEQYEESASLGLAQIAVDRKDYQAALALLRKVYQDNPSHVALLRNIGFLENLTVNN